MHRSRTILLSVAALFVALRCLAGQDCWTPLGPEGGSIMGVAQDPSDPATVYATSAGLGVIKSRDAGRTWQTVNGGITNFFLRSLAVDPLNPAIVYAGGYDKGPLYKSTDGGGHWEATSLPNFTGRGLTVDPVTEGTLWVAEADWLFRSQDGGQTWQGFPPPIRYTQQTITRIQIDPSAPSTLYYAWGYQGVWVTRNRGTTWASANAGLEGLPTEDLVLVPGNPSTLWRSVGGSAPGKYGVFRSTDAGMTWVSVSTGLPPGVYGWLAVDAQNPSSIYVLNAGLGLYHTADSGVTWQMVRNEFSGAGLRTLSVLQGSPAVTLLGTFGMGFFRSEDEGATWGFSNGGLMGTAINSLQLDVETPTTLYATTENGAFKSVDSGAHWSWMILTPDADGVTMIAQDPSSPDTIYAGWQRGRLWKSSDRGDSWEDLTASLPDPRVGSLAIDPLDSGTLYAGTHNGFHRSTDGGTTWVDLAASSSRLWGVYAMLISSNRGTIFVANSEGLLRSQDNGATWTLLPVGTCFGSWCSGLAGDPRSASTLYLCSFNIAYRSTDNGDTWSSFQVGPSSSTQLTSVAADPTYPSILYASGWGGVFRSVDSGATWDPLNNGLEADTVHQVLPDPAVPGHLYALPQAQSVVDYEQRMLVTDLKKSANPFRITITGRHLLSDVRVFINGVEWTGVKWKSEENIVLKGSGLKTAVRKYIPTRFRFENPDGSSAERTWSWP